MRSWLGLSWLAWSFQLGACGRPHIFFIALDDVGHSDTELYVGKGKTDIPTPHMNELASSGILLTNYYTQPVCSPTRTSFMTGLYPFRIGMQHTTTLVPGSTAGVPMDTPMLPELIKPLGYKTHMIGKWHLGYSRNAQTPHGRGFDEFYGYLQGQEDYYEKVMNGGYDFFHNFDRYDAVKGNHSLPQYMSIFENMLESYNATFPSEEDKQSSPFMIYFSHQTVHVPLEANQDAEECSHIRDKWRKVYCSMLVNLDKAMGQTQELIKRYGMWDNSLVLVSTDNGGMVRWGWDEEKEEPTWPASVGSNLPLRGSKATLFEGGVRGTAFITGGVTEKSRGTKYGGLMHAVDFFSIAHGVASGGSPAKPVDGLNLLPQAMAGLPSLRESVAININYYGLDYTGIRWGKWKLIVRGAMSVPANGYYGPGNADPLPAKNLTGTYHLFDLENDPIESSDVAEENPAIVKEGRDILKSYMKGGYQQPQTNLPHFRANPSHHDGAWMPFLKDHEIVSAADLIESPAPYEGSARTRLDVRLQNLDAGAFS